MLLLLVIYWVTHYLFNCKTCLRGNGLIDNIIVRILKQKLSHFRVHKRIWLFMQGLLFILSANWLLIRLLQLTLLALNSYWNSGLFLCCIRLGNSWFRLLGNFRMGFKRLVVWNLVVDWRMQYILQSGHIEIFEWTNKSTFEWKLGKVNRLDILLVRRNIGVHLQLNFAVNNLCNFLWQ